VPFGWGEKGKSAQPPETRLLDAFSASLKPDPGAAGPVADWTDRDTKGLLGRDHALFTAFMRDHVHSSYENGVLRFLTPGTQPSLVTWNGKDGWHSDWPSFAAATAFATNWMGHVFLLGTKPRADGAPREARCPASTSASSRSDHSCWVVPTQSRSSRSARSWSASRSQGRSGSRSGSCRRARRSRASASSRRLLRTGLQRGPLTRRGEAYTAVEFVAHTFRRDANRLTNRRGSRKAPGRTAPALDRPRRRPSAVA
jgi:hypothetical protein